MQNERIHYWFKIQQTEDLYRLLTAIKKKVPKGKYRNFFFVAFSNILKRSSKWLTKSIKPTIDKQKKDYPVLNTFKGQ
ncbi:MAG: hypothetical protein IPK10_15815 [Bacteroidetes bacterium]|nr:hypothetical protein [Bacteroidota bacterium]